MRALLSHAPGGPETLALAELPDPVAGPGEVVVRVMACAVNYPDALIIEDRYQLKPQRPFAPGCEIAGVIEAMGEGVTWPRVGDRVMAMPGWGGMVDRIAVPARMCFPLPGAMPFEDGASLIMTYGTSLHALKQRAKLRAGETLVVLGAAGGVGIAAVELGKAMGAIVIAGASSEAKLAFATARGADRGFVYPRGENDQRALNALVKEACGSGGADVVYDSVGGALSEAGVRSLAWKGRFLVVGFPAGIAKLPLNLLLLKGASAVGVFYGGFAEREPDRDRQNIAELCALYERGAIRPPISARFPLDRGGEAIAALSRPDTHGKLVVTIARAAG